MIVKIMSRDLLSPVLIPLILHKRTYQLIFYSEGTPPANQHSVSNSEYPNAERCRRDLDIVHGSDSPVKMTYATR